MARVWWVGEGCFRAEWGVVCGFNIVNVSDIGAVGVGDCGRTLDVVCTRVGMKYTFLVFNVIHSVCV